MIFGAARGTLCAMTEPLESQSILMAHVLVSTARADRDVAPAERRFIAEAFRVMGLGADERSRFEAMLDGTEPVPSLPQDARLPGYAERLRIFRGAVEVCVSDGGLTRDELLGLKGLIGGLRLKDADADDILRGVILEG